ncbi:hypothetical protein HN51_013457 [Arachis hypogaea]
MALTEDNHLYHSVSKRDSATVAPFSLVIIVGRPCILFRHLICCSRRKDSYHHAFTLPTLLPIVNRPCSTRTHSATRRILVDCDSPLLPTCTLRFSIRRDATTTRPSFATRDQLLRSVATPPLAMRGLCGFLLTTHHRESPTVHATLSKTSSPATMRLFFSSSYLVLNDSF